MVTKTSLPWRRSDGRACLTAVVQATYRFDSSGLCTVVDGRSNGTGDEFEPPLKAFAEVVVASELAPPKRGCRILGISLARGGDILVHKRVALVADVGIVDVDHASRPASLGRTLAPGGSSGVLSAIESDLRNHQSTPPDQWAAAWRGGEQILLSGFFDGPRLLRVRTPALHAFAVVALPSAHPSHVPLRGDTLTIHTADRLITMTFRGCIVWPESAGPLRVLRDDELRAGLAPCDDVEATLGLPRAWRAALEHRDLPRPPAVEPVETSNASGMTVGTTKWSWEPGKSRRVVIVKGTFDLQQGGEANLTDEQDALSGDVPLDGGKEGELRTASDWAPFKSKTDILLVGTAHGPAGASNVLVRIELASVRAELVAMGPRVWTSDGIPGPPGPFRPVPLVWSNAYGGGSHPLNPAGMGASEGTPPPLLERREEAAIPKTARREPVCFAPVSARWAHRSSRLGTFDRSWAAERWPFLPADVDPAYFQVAPPGLIAERVEEGARYAIRSVREGGLGIEGHLPAARPRAFVSIAGSEAFEVKLRLDSVSFDTDALRLHLVWRGSYELSPARPRALEKIAVIRERSDVHGAVDASVKIAALLCPPWHEAVESIRVEDRPVSIDEILTLAGKAPRGRFVAPLATLPATTAPPSRDEILARARAGKLARADLTDADLSRADLSGVDLSAAILRRANLTETKLGAANLERAILDSATARDAIFDGANLERATLHGAQLSRATFRGANVRRASFDHARLDQTVWNEALGVSASFVSAVLDDAVLDDALLEKSDFSYSSLARASFCRRRQRACVHHWRRARCASSSTSGADLIC